MRPAPLAKRVEAITAHAEEHGWQVVTDDATIADLPATLLGFVRTDRHPNDNDVLVPWSGLLGLGLNRSGRVGTLLDSERHGARFVLELDAIDRYWWTSRASGWADALRDPWAWVDKAPTAMELRLAPAIRRIAGGRA